MARRKTVAVSRRSWFVGVSYREGPLGDVVPTTMEETNAVLEHCRCRNIETMGHGTAQAQIPMKWVQRISRRSYFSTWARMNGLRYAIDVETP